MAHLDISMSLDGFITGPNEGVEQPLGEDHGRLHDWMSDRSTDADAEVLHEVHARTGAILMGRRMFEVGVEPWGDPPPFEQPVFVLTHEARAPMPMQGGTTYNFVTEGIRAYLEQATAAADGRDVGIWGLSERRPPVPGGGPARRAAVHLVPVLLGEGVRLFEGLAPEAIELKRTRTIEPPSATHLRFTVVK